MSDPSVREIHGVVGKNEEPIRIIEGEANIRVDLKGFYVFVTPQAARHLAQSLNRAARRIEARLQEMSK